MRTKLLFFYLLVSIPLWSQTDSLKFETYKRYFNNGYGQVYSNQDSAYTNFYKALALTKKQHWVDQEVTILSYLVFASSYHYNLPVMKQSMDALDTLLIKEKDTLKKIKFYSPTKDLLQLNQGNYYYKLNDYKRAKPYFLALYNREKSAVKTKENVTNLYSIYSFLTVIYTDEGKNELAENFCEKARMLLKEHPTFFENANSNEMLLNNYLARIYNNQKKHNLSIPLLEKSVDFYNKKTTDEYKNSLITSYQSLINSYILDERPEKALNLLQQTDKLYTKDNPFYKILQELYGDVFVKQGQYDKALSVFSSSLQLYKKYRNNEKHIDIASIEQKIASTLLKNQQPKEALNSIDEALTNVRLKNDKFLTTSKTIEILHLKSKILVALYEQNNKIETLEKALKNSLIAIDVLDEIKPTLENGTDKQLLINKAYPLFETALQTCFTLYEKTNTSTYINDAFFILEKSKSTQLLDALNKTKAIEFANVSSKIIDKEQHLLANVSALETNIFTSNYSPEKQRKLIGAKETYQNFLDSIKITQPKYHNLKYNYSVISLNEVKKDIRKDEGFIANFFGKKNLYQLVLTKDKTQFLRQEVTPNLTKELTSFYQTISDYKKHYNPEKGFDLYQKLVPKLVQEKQQLTVLPDGFLYYIPFEALSFQPKENSFLIKKMAISYANSFTLLKEQQEKTRSGVNKKVFAIAPEFYKTASNTSSKSRADFAPLIFNKSEVKNIASFITADTLVGKKATLQNIENKLQNYAILHFATHASANDEYPDFSYLAFTPKKGEQNLCYVKQIYNTNLSADLVTLSACQTGIGKVENGEGSISLARAFSYAGASALVQSLWKVDDRSSAEIMGGFYKELSNGIAKPEALQIAKNAYLKTEIKELCHPFYWAGFIISGNNSPIKTQSNYWWILLPLLALLIFLGYKKMKK